MKKLKRIKLINWHLFFNQTVEIKDNCLLSGENGSGKSTFLDAIQYVLTAGKVKFNNAANDKAKRNLIGYIRCKLGIEKKPYLRNGNVITHIALEFNDKNNKSKVIIGVVIEINKNNRINEHFYLINDVNIENSLFIENNIILNYRNFKKRLINCDYNFQFYDTKEKTRQAFLEVLGIKSKKYLELIPKALAFRPIEDLHKFVFDFLLIEKEILLDELRQNVQSYKELEKEIEVLKEKEFYLEEIKSSYKHMQVIDDSNKLLSQLNEYCKYQLLIKDKMNLENKINDINKSIQDRNKNKLLVEDKIKKIENEYQNIKLKLQKRDDYQYYKELERKIILYEEECKKYIAVVDKINEIIQSEKDLFEFVCKNYFTEIKSEKFIINRVINEKKLVDFISDVKRFYSKVCEKLFKEIMALNSELKNIKDNLVVINEEIDSLHKNKPHFDKHLNKLKKAIEREIKNKINKDYHVKVLCELIEVCDEKWRNALEGYLNTRRFDLIIDPIYFDIAIKVYENIKDKENIYGIGIVNTKFLEKYRHINPNSLASKIIASNNLSRYYVNMLLNQVICCEDISELKKYPKAISINCMVYQNYTVRNINKAIYNKPFIGMNALRIQLEKALKEKKVLEKEKNELIRLINEKNYLIKKIKVNKLDYIINNYQYVYKLDNINKELTLLKIEKAKIKENNYVFEIQNKIQEIQLELKELDTERNKCLIEIGKLSNELEIKKRNIAFLKDKINNLNLNVDEIVIDYYEDLNKKYNSIDKISKYCQEEIAKNVNKKKELEVNILTKMNHYNMKFQDKLNVKLEDIDKYITELERIKDLELVKYHNKAKEARMNSEVIFKEHFIYKLRENIVNAQKELERLNITLNRKKFGSDKYEFIYHGSLNQEFNRYYNIIMNDIDFDFSLFKENLSNKKQVILKEMFTKLISDNQDDYKPLCDYRNYMSYDIKIINENDEVMYFSKVSREKSGGETQTPFYVIIGASFSQLIIDKKNVSSCLVMFDEAFNNMDESRIKAMLDFYQQLDIQFIISVPPQRIETIFPYVNTILIVMKDKEQSYIETFSYDDIS